MKAFRAAVEAGDMDAGVALLADDVTFRSPAVFTPYQGREAVSRILRTVFEVFEDFRYTDELTDAGGQVSTLVFEARVGDKTLQGIDLIRLDDEGRIGELVVFVRPASGLMALGAEMGRRLQG